VTLSDEVQRFVREQRLGFVATVNEDGTPNLSPKGTTTAFDEHHLVFADIRSPGTIGNLRRDPRVEINVVDPMIRKGYRFRGVGTVHDDGPRFDELVAWYEASGVQAWHEAGRRIKAVVLVEVHEVRPLVSPGYDAGLTEDEMRAMWVEYWSRLGRATGR
jgi:predicted pyridoxine 5'-phosphate oxidase superfamily flavin-nucleotide-binding protein